MEEAPVSPIRPWTWSFSSTSHWAFEHWWLINFPITGSQWDLHDRNRRCLENLCLNSDKVWRVWCVLKEIKKHFTEVELYWRSFRIKQRSWISNENKIVRTVLCFFGCVSGVCSLNAGRWMLVWTQTELFLYDYDVRYTENYNHYLIAHTVTEHVKSCVSQILSLESAVFFPIRHNLLLSYEVASCGCKNPYEDFMYWLLYFLSTASYD